MEMLELLLNRMGRLKYARPREFLLRVRIECGVGSRGIAGSPLDTLRTTSMVREASCKRMRVCARQVYGH